MRALKIGPTGPPSQADVVHEDDVLRRWTERRRELLLVEKIARLAAAIEHLASVLERRAA